MASEWIDLKITLKVVPELACSSCGATLFRVDAGGVSFNACVNCPPKPDAIVVTLFRGAPHYVVDELLRSEGIAVQENDPR